MRRPVLALLFMMLPLRTAGADPPVTFNVALNFYGDNTEFSNPFRSSETLLGVHGRLFFDVELNDRVTVRAGAFGNQRFGSASAFELGRPVFALILRGRRSRLVFGTLETLERTEGSGPDRTTPHGLIPPLQVETLSFTRPYEAGLQWTVNADRVRQDVWINWQRLNTTAHRESFDAGARGRLSLNPRVSLGYQWHIVHHGGEQFGSGPVADSQSFGPGLIVESRVRSLDRVTAEIYGLLSRHVPDRGELARATTGLALFLRLSGERAGWRGHALVFRACDYLKEDGDLNYSSMRQDGSAFRATRDYAELGLTRTYRPADEVRIETSARLHRVEDNYDYSYRVLATVNLKFHITKN